MADQDNSSSPARQAIKLGQPSRSAAFILGLVGLASGGAAVFITHLEAGPVALLAAGLILFLIGLVGYAPTRLRIGDNEAEFAVVSSALATAVEAARPDARADVTEAVARVAEVSPQLAARAQSAIAWVEAVSQMVGEAAQRLGFREVDMESENQRTTGGYPESFRLLHAKAGGRRIAICLTPAIGDRFIKRLSTTSNQVPRDTALLLITRQPGSLEMDGSPGFYNVVVRDWAGAAALRAALKCAANGPALADPALAETPQPSP
ncbi:MAG: hypothetical protein ACRDNZ_13090 [Streptosporangiaceae bacterium]